MAGEYYDILWVAKNASAEDIKKAYRKKAMESHPDRHGGDKEKEAQFKKINEAYAVLSDEKKRAYYDQRGTMDGMDGWGWANGFEMNFDISDIFDSFFGQNFSGGRGGFHHAPQKAEDIEIKLKLSFAEAVNGCKKTVEFSKKTICDVCAGIGAKPGTKVETCGVCGGTGQVRRRVQTFFGIMDKMQPCEKCGGDGKIIEQKCEQCGGNKRVVSRVKKEIDIPAGIDDNITLRFSEEGHEWVGIPAGDLYVQISCPQSFDGLAREGNDLFYAVDIDPFEAVLWGKKKIKLPIIGERIIELKAGAQHGDVVKLKGDGVKHVQRDARGDLLLALQIKIPKHISAKEKALYEMIAQGRNTDKKDKGVLDKIFWD